MYNPYANYPIPQYQPQMPQIQNIQPQSPLVKCFFVSGKNELQNLQVEPNVVYIGINKTTKEIYLKSWNNNGIIESETYTIAEEVSEETELQQIMKRLKNIEDKLDERNVTNVAPTSNDGSDTEKPANGTVQSNDERKERRTAKGNPA
jgi:hypothetical protein